MSKRKVWQKFNFREWRSDKELRTCSREAQAVWLDLCGLIYEAGDKGRLSVLDGDVRRPYTQRELCTVLGDDPRVMRRVLQELLDHHVYDQDAEGFIVSRRILREELRAQLDENNGRLGGNPALQNNDLAETPVNPQVKAKMPEKEEERTLDIRMSKGADAPSFDAWESGVDLLLALDPDKLTSKPARQSARNLLAKHHRDLTIALGNRQAADRAFADAIAAVLSEELDSPNANPKTRLIKFLKERERRPVGPQGTVVSVKLSDGPWLYDCATHETFRASDDGHRVKRDRAPSENDLAVIRRMVDRVEEVRAA